LDVLEATNNIDENTTLNVEQPIFDENAFNERLQNLQPVQQNYNFLINQAAQLIQNNDVETTGEIIANIAQEFNLSTEQIENDIFENIQQMLPAFPEEEEMKENEDDVSVYYDAVYNVAEELVNENQNNPARIQEEAENISREFNIDQTTVQQDLDEQIALALQENEEELQTNNELEDELQQQNDEDVSVYYDVVYDVAEELVNENQNNPARIQEEAENISRNLTLIKQLFNRI
jgi:hypothetical protein